MYAFSKLQLPPNNQNPSGTAVLFPSFQVLSQQCYFHLFFTPITGIHTNSKPQAPQTLWYLWGVWSLTGEERIPGAGASVTQSPSCKCFFYHHLLSSSAAWYLCPRPQQVRALGRAAWLYRYLPGLLWARTTRTGPACRMPEKVGCRWAGGRNCPIAADRGRYRATATVLQEAGGY